MLLSKRNFGLTVALGILCAMLACTGGRGANLRLLRAKDAADMDAERERLRRMQAVRVITKDPTDPNKTVIEERSAEQVRKDLSDMCRQELNATTVQDPGTALETWEICNPDFSFV